MRVLKWDPPLLYRTLLPQQRTCTHLLLRDTLKHLQQVTESKECGKPYTYHVYVCLKTNS